MALSLKQIREEVRAGLGNREDLEPRIDKAINIAQQRIARAHKFDALYGSTDLSTTASTATLSLSSITNLDKIFSVVLLDSTSSRRLQSIPNRLWDKAIATLQSTTEARPRYYSRWGDGSLELLPTPDAVYTVRIKYSTWPSDLTDDNTTTALSNKEDIIIEYALHHLHKTLGNQETAEMYFRNYRNLLKEAIQDDETEFDTVYAPGVQEIPTDYWKDPFIKSLNGV